jgi:hypothetical protein
MSSFTFPDVLSKVSSEALNLFSYRRVLNQVPHPYKTTAKLYVLMHILIFVFLDNSGK